MTFKTFKGDWEASESKTQFTEAANRLGGQAGNVSGRGLDELLAWSLEHFEKHSRDCSLVERLYEIMSQSLMTLQAKQIKFFAYDYFGVSLKFDSKINAMAQPANVDTTQRSMHTTEDRKDILRQIKDETIGTANLYKDLNKKVKASKSTEQKYNEAKTAIEKKILAISDLAAAASNDEDLAAKIHRSLAVLKDNITSLAKQFEQAKTKMAESIVETAESVEESEAA